MAEIKKGLPKAKINWPKICRYISAVLIALLFSWFFQPRYHNNGNALTVVTTAFSILAGFLVTIMAISGGERVLKGENWRQDTYYLDKAKRDLKGYEWLLRLCLMVLVASFLVAIFSSSPECEEIKQESDWAKSFLIIIEYVLLFIACIAMLLWFSLPGDLKRHHLADLEKIIKDRRDNEINRTKQD